MDIVLLKSVDKLGAEGAVVRVKPGFARNYLIPGGLARLATAEALKHVTEQTRQRAARSAREKAQADTLKTQLERQAVTLTLTVGEDGKPFGSVTAHAILEALARGGVTLDKHTLHLDEPIKALGDYTVPVRLHPDVTAALKVSVINAPG